MVHGMLRVGIVPDQLHPSPHVRLQILRVLRMHVLQLSVCCRLVEQRRDKELAETIQCNIEVVRTYGEVVIRQRLCRVGIAAPCMLGHKFFVFLLLWVLLCAKEQHVFQEVRQALNFFGIGHGAYFDAQSCRGLVALRVRDDDGAQAVLQRQCQVLPVVLLRLLNGHAVRILPRRLSSDPLVLHPRHAGRSLLAFPFHVAAPKRAWEGGLAKGELA
mmetsp:Transcript_114383/g.363495  ORF Transcript_114383/g.363495 Transcript_114383/m.363495 type:complete len:216 (+) Transcript_114383:2712-3359(+)